MILHHNQTLLQDAIQATAAMLSIREIYVEKDYWVTVALYEIFHSAMADQAVFKGGTALSKCFKLIERFSEDIDIVVLRHRDETDNQLKKKIRTISKVVENVIPEIEVKGLTNKRGNIRKTVHQYNKQHLGDLGQVREHVILETSWFGNFEPYSKMPVSSYVYDMMQQKGQQELIQKYHLAPFEIQVLSKSRTFCEKIMSLVRFSRSNQPIADLRNKIRHVYDLHQLLKDREIHTFFTSNDFDEMIIKVGEDDLSSLKSSPKWIAEHPARACVFGQAKETWAQLRTTYNGNFKGLVSGQLPPETEILDTLNSIYKRLLQVNWDIQQPLPPSS